MSYPFYIHAATSLTASQHPCRLFFAAAAVAAPFILISNNAYAALNCTTQPTCEQLGYSKSVDANCDDYILCPFDTSYKKCIKKVESKCADYPFEECPEGASCISCNDGTDTFYKCSSEAGYVMDGNTCVQVCSGPGHLVDLVPKNAHPSEWYYETYNGTTYICFIGCDYNIGDGYDGGGEPWGYDPVKNECLPTNCVHWFSSSTYFTAENPPKNYIVECLSGETMYYSCPTIHINGTWQKATYDEATNTCITCSELGYTLTQAPSDDDYDTCGQEEGGTYFRRHCNGYNITEKPSGIGEEAYESCFDGETTKYKCAAGYEEDPYEPGYCYDRCTADNYNVFSYCPDPTGENCTECPMANGTINYFFSGSCPNGYFFIDNSYYGYGCIKDGTMVCEGDIYTCVADCEDPWASGSCPGSIDKCYTIYDCHTYRNGKKYKCGRTGCQP